MQNNPEPLTCTSRLSVCVVPRNQSVAAKPLDKVLIRKIIFGKKIIRTQPKTINFDPRAPHQRTRDEEGFENGSAKTSRTIDIYDIASNRFKSIVDEHISNMTVTDEEIRETERLTRGQNKNQEDLD